MRGGCRNERKTEGAGVQCITTYTAAPSASSCTLIFPAASRLTPPPRLSCRYLATSTLRAGDDNLLLRLPHVQLRRHRPRYSLRHRNGLLHRRVPLLSRPSLFGQSVTPHEREQRPSLFRQSVTNGLVTNGNSARVGGEKGTLH